MNETIDPGIVIEAALLTSPIPLKIEDLVKLFNGARDEDAVAEALGKLAERWQERGLRLAETQNGWRFQSAPEIAEFITRLTEERPVKYSRAVMETLAIIAYRQPATRGDIEEIRGVTVNPNVIRQLEERGWIEVIGHRETAGRPALFATTIQFLDDLGLKSLADLPPLNGEVPTAEEFELDFPNVPESMQEPSQKSAAGENEEGVVRKDIEQNDAVSSGAFDFSAKDPT